MPHTARHGNLASHTEISYSQHPISHCTISHTLLPRGLFAGETAVFSCSCKERLHLWLLPWRLSWSSYLDYLFCSKLLCPWYQKHSRAMGSSILSNPLVQMQWDYCRHPMGESWKDGKTSRWLDVCPAAQIGLLRLWELIAGRSLSWVEPYWRIRFGKGREIRYSPIHPPQAPITTLPLPSPILPCHRYFFPLPIPPLHFSVKIFPAQVCVILFALVG